VKLFLDGQSQAGDTMVKDGGANRKPGLLMEDPVKRLLDGFISRPKFVAAAVSAADGGL